MNILLVNKNKPILQNIGIPVEQYDGVFEAVSLGNDLKNINYDKLIIDITAIKDYQKINVFAQLKNFVDVNKIVLFLSSEVVNREYINALVSLGIYNFSMDIDVIKNLIIKPNTYDDVKEIDINKLKINSEIVTNTKSKIIGFQNVTMHAGSTTLIYSLVKHAKKKYNVIGIEVDSNDFAFFNNPNLVSTISNKIRYIVNQNGNKDIIFIDINDSEKAKELCDEVIYLVEPTTIKINKLIMAKPNVFRDLFDKKIVLNRSSLSKWDIAEFENEAKIKIYDSIPSVNERTRKDKNIINFLKKLGFKM